jgi:xylulokinase
MDSDELIMGIDIGTMNCKVSLFSTKGKLIAQKRPSTPSLSSKEGWVEYDPKELWQMVSGLIRDVTTNVNIAYIRGLSVTGMGEAGVPINSSGQPIYPAISWMISGILFLS